MPGEQQLEQFHANTLARQLLEPSTTGNAGRHAFGIGCPLPVLRVKSEEPQNAQIIFRDAAGGGADESHSPRSNICKTTHIVVNHALARCRERVHCKIPALGIAFPVATESDLRSSAEGLDLLAQRGDLERLPVGNGGNGAVLNASRERPASCRLDPADDFFRQRRGRDIDVPGWIAKERMPNRPPSPPGLLSRTV